MNSIIPAESRLQLVADSDSEVETYWFQSNGFVRAITGVSDGPVCAPLFRYRFLSEDSIELIGHDGVAGTWTRHAHRRRSAARRARGQARGLSHRSLIRIAHEKNGPEGPFVLCAADPLRRLADLAYRPAWRVNDTLGFL